MSAGHIVNIPVEALSLAALDGVIDDYIHREGTDYGHRDYDLAQKRAAVRAQLASGRAMITFDARTQTTTIVPSGR